MKKKLYLIICVFLISCNSKKSSNAIDESKFTILKTDKSISLNNEDFHLAEKLAKQRIEIYNAEEIASSVDRGYFLGDSLHNKGRIIEFGKYYK